MYEIKEFTTIAVKKILCENVSMIHAESFSQKAFLRQTFSMSQNSDTKVLLIFKLIAISNAKFSMHCSVKVIKSVN